MGHNPFIYSIILSIYERKSDLRDKYLHEADIIENYLEILLKKHKNGGSNTPRYKDLVLLLGYLAYEMARSGRNSIEEADFYSKSAIFTKENYFDHPVSDFIQAILGAGVLKKYGEAYRFTQSCFYYFSFAYYADKDIDAQNWICVPSRIITHGKTIEYLSAIRKNDIQLLEQSKKWTNEILAEFYKDGKYKNQSASVILSQFKAKKELINLDRFNLGELKECEEIDEKMDEIKPLQASSSILPETHETDTNFTMHRRLAEAISLYAKITRASEHLLKKDVTQLYFNTALDFYDSYLAITLYDYHQDIIPKIMEMTKNMLKDNESVENSESFLKKIRNFFDLIGAVIPNHISTLINEELVNNKTKDLIKDVIDDAEPLRKLLLIFSLCDLDDPDGFKRLKDFSVEEGHFFYMVVFHALYLSNMNADISKPHREQAKAIIESIMKVRKNKSRIIDTTSILELQKTTASK